MGNVYRMIERPRVLAFTWLPSWDEEATETLVRFDLDERDGVTRVRLTHSGFATEGSRAPSRLCQAPSASPFRKPCSAAPTR
jgi:uncharacterized protein YndB with AHSA1/START domain